MSSYSITIATSSLRSEKTKQWLLFGSLIAAATVWIGSAQRDSSGLSPQQMPSKNGILVSDSIISHIVNTGQKNRDFADPIISKYNVGWHKNAVLPQHFGVKTRNSESFVQPLNEEEMATSVFGHPVADGSFPAVPLALVNVSQGKGFHVSAAGKGNYVLALQYDPELIPNGFRVSDIYSFRYNESNRKWEQLARDSVSESQHLVYSQIVQEGDFINAVIKVPEAPQTQGYAPTTMSEIKTADPASGIQLIKTPEPNNQGSASMGFTIEVPPGRLGLQPNLQVNYNSDGTNGFLGEGWSLGGISSISVDTRWGVPRYQAANETETYLLDGAMLAFNDGYGEATEAHRTPGIIRVKDRIFYPRKENSFNRIIRKGDNPNNYYWIITDKNGTKYYYGGITQSDQSAILCDPNNSHNISEWKLTKVEDVFKNFIEYNYDVVTTQVGSLAKRSIYLKSISYTKHTRLVTHYLVSLSYETGFEKQDVYFNARYGFLSSVNDKLLGNISVALVTDNDDGFASVDSIRSYRFHYRSGEFGKTLLDSVSQYGFTNNTAAFFYGYRFSYFNLHDFQDKLFAAPQHLTGLTEDPLGGSQNIPRLSFGAAAGVGVFDGMLNSKSMTADIQFGYHQFASSGTTALADINGDGLPDIILKDGSGLSYHPNTSTSSAVSFGPVKPITGVRSFSEDEGSRTSSGWQVNGPGGIGFYGHDNASGTSYNKVYFADVNGDGLLDIVDNGVVKFNHALAGQPTIDFTSNSTGTGNPIIASGRIATEFQPSQPELDRQKLENIANSPLLDMVKVWIAPESGNIDITAPVKIIQPVIDPNNSDEVARYAKADGVVVSIQRNQVYLQAPEPIAKNDVTAHFTNTISQPVNKGDKLFFRVQSGNTPGANGDFDQVVWNPVIRYTSKEEGRDVIDVFGEKKFVFESAKDMLLSDGVFGLPDQGSFAVKGRFHKESTADKVFARITKVEKEVTGNLPDTAIIVHRDGAADTTIILTDRHTYREVSTVLANYLFDTAATSKDIEVISTSYTPGAKLLFETGGLSNVNLKHIQWKPTVQITHADPAHGNQTVTDIIPAFIRYQFKGYLFQSGSYFSVRDSGDVTIYPKLVFKANSPGRISFIISDASGVLRKKDLMGSVGLNDSIKIVRDKNQSFFVNYEMDNIDVVDTTTATGMIPRFVARFPDVSNWRIPYNGSYEFYAITPGDLKRTAYQINGVIVGPTGKDTLLLTNQTEGNRISFIDTVTHQPVDFLVLIKDRTVIWTDPLQPDYGNLYRGWGQFVFNGMSRLTSPIFLSDAVAQQQQQTNITRVSFFSTILNKDSFFVQGPNIREFIKGDIMGASRLTKADVDPINVFSLSTNVAGDGAYAIIKQTESNSSCSAGGAIITFSDAPGGSSQQSEYLDMNGDHYPDIIGQGYIQYTTAQGGLAGATPVGNSGLQQSSLSSHGYNLGGMFNHAYGTVAKSNTKESSQNASGGSQVAETMIGLFPLSGAGNNYDNDNVTESLYDVNGDGLPDRISGGQVFLNLGYGFASPALNLGFSATRNNHSETSSLGGGINWGNNSFSAGYNLSSTNTSTGYALMDVNGDGLLDEVSKNGNGIAVRINKGSSLSTAIGWDNVTRIGENVSDSKGIGGSFTIGFSPFIIPIKIVFSASANTAEGSSRGTAQLIDINADGFADYVTSDAKGEMMVSLSNLGKINKLKGASGPLGGSFQIDYSHNQGSFDHPGGKWIFSSLKISDGITDDGADQKKTFEYLDGKYDRYEREFLGFAKVIENDFMADTIYRKHVEQFATNHFYLAGHLTSVSTEDARGARYIEKTYQYHLYIRKNAGYYHRDEVTNISGVYNGIVQTPVKLISNISYEGNNNHPLILNESAFTDDTLGNTIEFRYSNKGKLNSGGQFDYQTTIQYQPADLSAGIYVFGLPTSFDVKDMSGKIFRHQTAEYYPWGSGVGGTGPVKRYRLKSQTVFVDAAKKAITKFTYDDWGNIDSKTTPNNFSYKYNYDDSLKTHVRSITDGFGLKNVFFQDLKFGSITCKIFTNDKRAYYRYDAFGRINTIVGVLEATSNPSQAYTLVFDYHPLSNVPYAITKHFDQEHRANGIFTIQYVDGWDRNVQVKKTAEIGGANKWIISGRNYYDALGRMIKSYQPTIKDYYVTGGGVNAQDVSFERSYDALTPTTYTYDILDRTMDTRLPDGKLYSSNTYLIGKDGSGNDAQGVVTVFTDDRTTNRKELFLNGSGAKAMQVEYQNKALTQKITTQYQYDPIGQLETVLNNRGKVVLNNQYDIGGRRTRYYNNASGAKLFEYDEAGLLRKKTEARSDLTIEYKYEYDRLIGLNYPKHPENNVRYVYGNKDDVPNSRGKIIFQDDASGAQSFAYDAMGNIISNKRTIIAPFDTAYTFTTRFAYDSWNRLMSMEYPGGETVKYSYNNGGLLQSVIGSKKGSSAGEYPYVTGIAYDKFEQRGSIIYGNGITTTLQYEDQRRRLKEVNTIKTQTTTRLMSTTYAYDDMNNVKTVTNVSGASSGIMGLTMKTGYGYDNLNRLITGEGDWDNGKATYKLAMVYDDLYNISTRDLSLQSATVNRSINSDYHYDAAEPTQLNSLHESIVRNSGSTVYKEGNTASNFYDKDGNNSERNIADSFQAKTLDRKIIWDEEQRMRSISLNGNVTNYLYDGDGERTVKINAGIHGVYVNGKLAAEQVTAGSFSLYPNAFFSMRNGDGIGTKHIYIGRERIVSQLTDFSFWDAEDRNGIAKAVACNTVASDHCIDLKYSQKFRSAELSINNYYDTFRLPHKTMVHGLFRTKPALQYAAIVNPGVAQGATAVVISITADEKLQYFYHSNYLGNVGFVSDIKGDAVHYLEYLPYGELFMEQRQNYSSQFSFNGKEQDAETGLYYYGARYYDPHAAQWLNADPMAEKYPAVSPYNFCLGNPLRVIDPTGRETESTLATEIDLPIYNLFKEKPKNEYDFKSKSLEALGPFVDDFKEGLIADRKALPIDAKLGTFGEFAREYELASNVGKGLNVAATGFDIRSHYSEYQSGDIDAAKLTWRSGISLAKYGLMEYGATLGLNFVEMSPAIMGVGLYGKMVERMWDEVLEMGKRGEIYFQQMQYNMTHATMPGGGSY